MSGSPSNRTDSVRSCAWAEQLWSLGLFAIAGIVFIMQYGSFRLRLERIVALFESAQEGDFGAAYNADADTSPDAITRVGRAYNQVRLQLASMVLTDPLTGCFNRRGLDQAIAREIARSRRSGSELSVLAIDLDHFKAINDTHGHVAGDIVLREFGALLVHTARAGDIVARAGGEEFLALLPDTDLGGATRAALRLCDFGSDAPVPGERKTDASHDQHRRRLDERDRERRDRAHDDRAGRRGALRREAERPRPSEGLERRVGDCLTSRTGMDAVGADAPGETATSRRARVSGYFLTTLTRPALLLDGRITMSMSRPRRANMRRRRSVENPRSFPVTTSEICDGASRMMYAASVCVRS